MRAAAHRTRQRDGFRGRPIGLTSVGLLAALVFLSTVGCAESRLQRVRKRGHLVCGVSPEGAGHDEADNSQTGNTVLCLQEDPQHDLWSARSRALVISS